MHGLRIRTIGAVALLATYIHLAPAVAGDAPKPGPGQARLTMIFKSMDADGDGKLAKGEWRLPPDLFSRADADADGFVSLKELSQVIRMAPGSQPTAPRPTVGRKDRYTVSEILAVMDTDRDGRISQAEWPMSQEIFPPLDTNKDGWLSDNEIRRHIHIDVGVPLPPGRQVPPRFAGETVDVLLAVADANRDRKLSVAELKKLTDLIIEKSGDGVVTKAELHTILVDALAERTFRRQDRNGNGTLVWGEWRVSNRIWQYVDTNNDKKIDRAEWRKAECFQGRRPPASAATQPRPASQEPADDR